MLARVGQRCGRSPAQQAADFSGSWTSQAPQAATGQRRAGRNRPADDSRDGLGSGWGLSFTIVQDEQVLQVQRDVFARNDMQPQPRFRYLLGGESSTNTLLMGRGLHEQVSTANWDGDKLVIRTVFTFPHPDSGERTECEVTQRLSLVPQADPQAAPSLRIETTRGGVLGGPVSRSQQVYRRQ